MLSLIHSLMDVKQGQNKQGKTVLYLVFEYMDTDLKKFIRSCGQTGENIPVKNVKVYKFNVTPIFYHISLRGFSSFLFNLITNLYDPYYYAELDVSIVQGCGFLPWPWSLTQVSFYSFSLLNNSDLQYPF